MRGIEVQSCKALWPIKIDGESERVRERKIALPLNVLKDLAHVQVIHLIDVGIQNY